jgi:hypothetical protein
MGQAGVGQAFEEEVPQNAHQLASSGDTEHNFATTVFVDYLWLSAVAPHLGEDVCGLVDAPHGLGQAGASRCVRTSPRSPGGSRGRTRPGLMRRGRRASQPGRHEHDRGVQPQEWNAEEARPDGRLDKRSLREAFPAIRSRRQPERSPSPVRDCPWDD